ncbi:MAG: carboxylating nicotinate-nucleotide diphosphorylase [Bacteroidota bacterium]|nr:carboxylating nicotinate-nucleotide diphosphorylase [Bacteroidota bacterium]
MYPDYVTDARLRKAIKDALAEDIGPGDYTSLSSVPSNAVRSAKLLFKEEGIAAGLELAGFIFKQVDKTLKVEFHKIDGDEVKKGDVGFIVTGPAQSILRAERLVLNCMQRMCGIATLTREYVRQISHTRAKLLDTRKTTPNFRIFEKWAVRIGGGQNHRFGLYDMILLKDNHIDYAGGVRKAILNTVKYLHDNHLDLKIEIEVRNLEELKQVIDTGKVNRILLDNMLLSVMAEAIKMVNRQYETEASGGVNINTIKSIAETGVDFISVGKITHSFKSMDISLKAV